MNAFSLKKLRYQKRLTIRQLSSQLTIAEKRIKILERQLEQPSIEELRILSDFFKVPHQQLFSTLDAQEKVIGEGYVTAKDDVFRVYKPMTVRDISKKVPVLDLFCGVGGLSYGFEQTEEFITIAGVDLLEDRIKTFQLNHPHAMGCKVDIRQYLPEHLDKELSQNPSIIVGGAPCQGFSSIRPFRNLSENDQRNNLFHHFLRYLVYFNPNWFVFENVVGLLKHKKGKTLGILLEEFKKIGYKLNVKVLNCAYYGVPQLRERLFIVGNNQNISFEFPKPTHYYHEFKSMVGKQNSYLLTVDDVATTHYKPAVTTMEAISDLRAIASGEASTEYISEAENEYQKYLRAGSTDVENHCATKHSAKMLTIIKQSGYNIDAVKHLVNSGFSSCYSRLEPNKPSVTLTVNFVNPSSNKCIHPIQNRALSPREGARIQGFPDKFKFYGTRTQIVKQIGNAVPPILSKRIAEKILSYL